MIEAYCRKSDNGGKRRLSGGEQLVAAPISAATPLRLSWQQPFPFSVRWCRYNTYRGTLFCHFLVLSRFFTCQDPAPTSLHIKFQSHTLLTVGQAWSSYRHVPLQNLQTNLSSRDKALHLAMCPCGSANATSPSAQGGRYRRSLSERKWARGSEDCTPESLRTPVRTYDD